MNSKRKGRAAELRVAKWYRSQDWLIAFREREEGPGDMTANRLGEKPQLIETKSTARGPFSNFPPADRDALRLCAIAAGMVPVLAWSPSPTREPRLYGPKEWPGR